jgi:hypothetical protein
VQGHFVAHRIPLIVQESHLGLQLEELALLILYDLTQPVIFLQKSPAALISIHHLRLRRLELLLEALRHRFHLFTHFGFDHDCHFFRLLLLLLYFLAVLVADEPN